MLLPRRRPFRCTFVQAPDLRYSTTQNYGAKFLPVWAYKLAAHLPEDDGLVLKIVDLQFDLLEEIPEADLFLFSGINQDIDSLRRARASVARRFPGAKTAIGGPICWSFDQVGSLDLLRDFDHVCVGDGEEIIAPLVQAVRDGTPLPHIVRAPRRFEMSRSRPMHQGLLASTVHRYYGAVVEVSRGCPFLCEFCDIRVMADNNRSHLVSPEVIVKELDFLARLGVRQLILACDNFIGDLPWAERVVDEIIRWQNATGFRINVYTWLTINLYRSPALMAKMRQAGFDLLFIGIESFHEHSLLETAKLQNAAVELTDAIRLIQSYGFIIVAGLIFGFDSDPVDYDEITLQGILNSGLISGDPNWLTALPGTPLFRRMKLSGRLRYSVSTHGGVKYQTNIRYLMPRDQLIGRFKRFIREYLRGSYQYARFKTYLENLESARYHPVEGSGFGSLALFFRLVLTDPRAMAQMARRVARFVAAPSNIYYALKGLALTLSKSGLKGRFGFLQFWGFAWTNAMFKYDSLRDEDFDIQSVGPDFDIRSLIPRGYEEDAVEAIPRQKTIDQLRASVGQLKRVMERRTASAARAKETLPV